MADKLNNFVIGLVEIFSIVIPGAVIAFFFSGVLFRPYAPKVHETIKGGTGTPGILEALIFLAVAYLLGQFLHLVGTVAIQPLYEVVYRRVLLKRGNPVTPQVKELLVSLFGNDQKPLRRAHAFVDLHSPVASAQLERYEANTKLFRSLTVVFMIIAVRYLALAHWWAGLLWLLLAVLAFGRFVERRWKQTVTIYDFFILVHKSQGLKSQAATHGQ